EFDLRRSFYPSQRNPCVGHGDGVVGPHLGSVTQKQPNHVQCRRFPHIVRAGLEGQAQDTDRAATHALQDRLELFHHPLPLTEVHHPRGLHDRHLVPVLFAHGNQSCGILGETTPTPPPHSRSAYQCGCPDRCPEPPPSHRPRPSHTGPQSR